MGAYFELILMQVRPWGAFQVPKYHKKNNDYFWGAVKINSLFRYCADKDSTKKN